MAAGASRCLFLMCWFLRTASLAFPEEPGPVNFIPAEGNDLLPFLPCRLLFPCVHFLIRHSVKFWAAAKHALWWIERVGAWSKVTVKVAKVTLALTRSVLTGIQVRQLGATSRTEDMPVRWSSNIHEFPSRPCLDPPETQFLQLSDSVSPDQLSSLQLWPDFDWLQFNNTDWWFTNQVRTLPKHQYRADIVRLLNSTLDQLN